jgi:cytidyltransferase-like protein
MLGSKKDIRRRLIASVYLLNLTGNSASYERLSENLGLDLDAVKQITRKLAEQGLITVKGSSVRLTKSGRSAIKVVLSGGVFDIIHPGHIYTLKKAKALGDVLVVVVARNETVKRLKGSEPLHDEKLRQMLVSSIRFVDAAILGSTRDIFETVELVKPDIIALGYDQIHDEDTLLREGRSRGLEFKVVRLDSPYPYIKSRDIKSKLGLAKRGS